MKIEYEPYHLFLWKNLCEDFRLNNILINQVFNEIRKIEKNQNRKILVEDSIYNSGRFIGFSILTDSMLEDEVNFLFDYIKDKLEIRDEFIYNSGYYSLDKISCIESIMNPKEEVIIK